MGRKGTKQAVARLAVLQGEHEFWLLLDRESAVAMLHPDVVASTNELPERFLVVKLEGSPSAEFCAARKGCATAASISVCSVSTVISGGRNPPARGSAFNRFDNISGSRRPYRSHLAANCPSATNVS